VQFERATHHVLAVVAVAERLPGVVTRVVD